MSLSKPKLAMMTVLKVVMAPFAWPSLSDADSTQQASIPHHASKECIAELEIEHRIHKSVSDLRPIILLLSRQICADVIAHYPRNGHLLLPRGQPWDFVWCTQEKPRDYRNEDGDAAQK